MQNERAIWTKRSPYLYRRGDGREVRVNWDYTKWHTVLRQKPFKSSALAKAWLDKHHPASLNP